MSRIALIVALALTIAACASNSEVQDLEQDIKDLQQQVADLEQATQEAPATKNLDIELTTVSLGTDERPSCRARTRGSITTIKNWVKDDTAAYILNGADTRIGLTRLGEATRQSPNDAQSTRIFMFTIQDVPANEGVYRIEIGQLSWELGQQELEQQNWSLTLQATG